MAVESSPAFLQANTYSAEITRRAVNVSWQRNSSGNIGSVAGGVFGIGSDLVMSAPSSGMTVNNATGEALVPGTSSTTQSGYYFRGSSTTNTSVAASNPTNPRIDLVCATVNDQGYVGSLNTGVIQVVTGTPTSGATLANLSGAPALPTSSLLIGYILVPANATSIITADLSATTVTPVAYSAQNIFNAVAVSASTAISAVSGSHYIVSATSPTITLPAPFKNARVKVTNYGSGVPVVSHNASEVIYGPGYGSAGKSSVSISRYGMSETFESDGTTWYTTSGQGLAINLFGVDATMSGSAPAAPGQFLLQAGQQSVSFTAGVGQLTFPTSFPNGLLSCVLTLGGQATSANGSLFVGNPSSSAVNVYFQYGGSAWASNASISYIAIGF